jgi:hypothetical protein
VSPSVSFNTMVCINLRQSCSPSNEWQNDVVAMLHSFARSRNTNIGGDNEFQYPRGSSYPTTRRLRRKIESQKCGHKTHGYDLQQSSVSQGYMVGERSPVSGKFVMNGSEGGRSSNEQENLNASDSEDGLTDAVGQLSLNEHEQVRYHGKASGLHLLGVKERVDARNEGGIW